MKCFKVSSINIQGSVRDFRPQQICIQEVFELRLLNAQIINFLLFKTLSAFVAVSHRTIP